MVAWPSTVERVPTPSKLVERLLAGCTTTEAMEHFDALPAVAWNTLTDDGGRWRGTEVSVDHPLSGLLRSFGWHGKRFESKDAVHPLVFTAIGGGTFSINPGYVPMSIGRHVPRWKAGKWLMTLLRPLVSTRRPKARLWPVEYHGVISAAMIYDQIPIVDVFRQIDADTFLGAMSYRGNPDYYGEPQPFFLLQREPHSYLPPPPGTCGDVKQETWDTKSSTHSL